MHIRLLLHEIYPAIDQCQLNGAVIVLHHNNIFV